MGQPTLFDKAESQRRKDEGMAVAADYQLDTLALARRIAVEVALSRCDRTVVADDVGRLLKSRHGIASLGPATGSLFKGKDWQFTGRRVRSARKSNHARELKVWRYIGIPKGMEG